MRILLITPLYPPDIAGGALYAKELATQLTTRKHKVAILTYSNIPEKVPGVDIIFVSKHLPIPLRIPIFFYRLLIMSHCSDLVILTNGVSVEFPFAILSLLRKPRVFFCMNDTDRPKMNFIEKWSRFRVVKYTKQISVLPYQKPEILPFSEFPTEEMLEHKLSWEKHLAHLSV